ncbi:hypothetical protein [Paenibacillus sp. Soil724D2]|uniref:phage adaptor protein n=1 Tax=Paenibacillus sp. (strain Soil724D2) TaxID=1736392 RepID=UPI0007158A8A|nr:hypothetical protein [Paenibacillus sp. Soil724D2]KRE33293.1 hypothetical protein ASG85_13515 [Paenibacillus sp. Soil724D2]
MNVQQILDEIQEKYPHGLSDASVMRKLDEIQKELFRTIYKPVVIDVMDIVNDSEFYILGYSNTKVIDVTVNGVEYTEANVKGVSPSSNQFYWFVGDSVLGLYPTPTTDITDGLMITRYKVPQILTSVANIPDFDPDFHMMLVYYACKIIAENYKDFDTANGFFTQYKASLKSFNMSKQATQDYSIQNVYGRLVPDR